MPAGEQDVAARVHALYGQPGFESWAAIARALRVPRGSAWSLAHGLRQANERTLQLLEAAEFRQHLPQAVANLRSLIGEEPILPVSYTRPQAARLQRKGGSGG